MGADDEWKEEESPPFTASTLDNELSDDLSALDRILLGDTEVVEPTLSVSQELPSTEAPEYEFPRDDSSSTESPTFETIPTGTEATATRQTIGGFSFFLSLLALTPTSILTIILAFYTWHSQALEPTCYFLGAILLGSLSATLLIRGHLSVLLHEFKHQIVSNLVGNKAKSLHVEANSGHFEYAYTKKTSHYNAFISVAPYIVPLFTFIFTLLALAFGRGSHTAAVLILGFGYGIDLVLNIRDISPIQTDITEIRGGYHVGLWYIIVWNIAILGVILAWVFHGVDGFLMLLHEFSALFFHIHAWIRGAGGEGG